MKRTVIFIGMCGLLVSLLFSNVCFAQGENTSGTMKKEWNIFDPRANDPDQFPKADETSLDISYLSSAKSLKEIYSEARKMKPNSASDYIVLGQIVTSFIQSCCSDYESAMALLKKAGFKEIEDITEAAIKRPEAYRFKEVSYDRAVFSKRIGGIEFSGLMPEMTFYKIQLFFLQGEFVRASAQIHSDPLF